MRHPTFFLACLCATALLAGCASLHPAKKEKKDDDDGLSWAQEPVPPATNGAIYQVGRDVTLFENPIARHVGDVVTIDPRRGDMIDDPCAVPLLDRRAFEQGLHRVEIVLLRVARGQLDAVALVDEPHVDDRQHVVE